jgi:hypothetical protein
MNSTTQKVELSSSLPHPRHASTSRWLPRSPSAWGRRIEPRRRPRRGPGRPEKDGPAPLLALRWGGRRRLCLRVLTGGHAGAAGAVSTDRRSPSMRGGGRAEATGLRRCRRSCGGGGTEVVRGRRTGSAWGRRPGFARRWSCGGGGAEDVQGRQTGSARGRGRDLRSGGVRGQRPGSMRRRRARTEVWRSAGRHRPTPAQRER